MSGALVRSVLFGACFAEDGIYTFGPIDGLVLFRNAVDCVAWGRPV